LPAGTGGVDVFKGFNFNPGGTRPARRLAFCPRLQKVSKKSLPLAGGDFCREEVEQITCSLRLPTSTVSAGLSLFPTPPVHNYRMFLLALRAACLVGVKATPQKLLSKNPSLSCRFYYKWRFSMSEFAAPPGNATRRRGAVIDIRG
jgi:hypothetical protein